MIARLPQRTKDLLDACFASAEQRNQIAERLEREISKEDRIRFSIIKLILERPNKDYVDVVFDLAKTDWRDLLLAAGHGESYDERAWAEKTILERPGIVFEEPTQKTLKVDERGWARCPTCNFRFKLSDPNAWDGTMH